MKSVSQRAKRNSGGLARRIARTVLPWAGCWLLLAACGGAMEAKAPQDGAVAGVEEAEASFDAAEQDLQALLLADAAGEVGVAAEAIPSHCGFH